MDARIMTVSNNTDGIYSGPFQSLSNVKLNTNSNDERQAEWGEGKTWMPTYYHWTDGNDWQIAPTTITAPNTGGMGQNPIPAVMPGAPRATPEEIAELLEQAFRRLRDSPEEMRILEERSCQGMNPGPSPEKKPEGSVKKKPRRMIQI